VTAVVEMIVPHDAGPSVHACAHARTECLRERGLDVRTADVACASAAAALVIVEPDAAMPSLASEPLRIAGLLRQAAPSRFGSAAAADRPFHAAAAASAACSRESSRHLTAQGIPTAHLKPRSHGRLCAPRNDPRAVAFGAHARASAFREGVLAQASAVAGTRSCDLRIFAGADAPGQLQADEWLAWLTRVDVLASLPLEPRPGMEWCEIGPAVMNGAVVLTTGEADFGQLEPGADLAAVTGAAYADGGRRERMCESAFSGLSEHPLDIAPLVDAIASVAESSRRARPSVLPAVAA
jgi:hypothetical protein